MSSAFNPNSFVTAEKTSGRLALHGEKKFMAAETTESTLKDNISSFCLLRSETEPGKGINFVGNTGFAVERRMSGSRSY